LLVAVLCKERCRKRKIFPPCVEKKGPDIGSDNIDAIKTVDVLGNVATAEKNFVAAEGHHTRTITEFKK